MKENKPMRTITAGMAAGLVLLLAACSSPAPSATQAPAATPSPTVLVKNISCEEPPQATENGVPVKIVIDCQRAVAAALSLVTDREHLRQVEFHYGSYSYCSPGLLCALPDRTHQGYVIFRFGSASPTDLFDPVGDFMVSVQADDAGNVSTTSGMELLTNHPIIN